MPRLPDQLPAACAAPLDTRSVALPGMTAAVGRLLAEACGGVDVFAVVRTRTKADVGEWFRNGRVWACATATDLVLLAAGRIPFVQRTPFGRLQESVYNHITGELVLAPGRELRVNRVRVTELDGYQLLAQIRRESNSNRNRVEQHA